MSSRFTRVIHQNLVNIDGDGRLDIVYIRMSDLSSDYSDLRTLVERNEGRSLGLSAAFLPNGTLQILAIADATSVLLLDFIGDKNNGRASPPNASSATEGRDYLRDHILGRECGFVYAFDIAPLALALWQSHDLRIKQAIDLQSAGSPMTRAPRATIKLANGGSEGLFENNITRTFDDFICPIPDDACKTSTTTPLAQRAWVAHYISQLAFMEERLSQVPPVDTFKLTDTILRFLAKSSADSFQRDQLKPTEVTRAYSTSFDGGKKQLHVHADRYQNKIRKGRNQQAQVHISAHDGVGSFTISAHITSVQGGSAQLETEGSLAGKQVSTITLGREAPTAAEVKRTQIILMVLQGIVSVDGSDFNPWINKIYLNPGDDFMWPAEWSQSPSPPIKFNPDNIPRPLNGSQRKAIKHMLNQSDSSRLTIIQGPPGTGKTTVIASFVQTAVSAGRSGIWLIAQSNIAVKNIAEKLTNFGLNYWKLLVSDDFYSFWHEHLYTSIRANIITGGEISGGRLSELNGCPVVLCTLSMLSNDMLRKLGAFRRVPLDTVVIDEASQIEIGDYIPLFSNFTTIRKAIFIGDNMQLPPHGQDDIQDLQSVFEVGHLTAKDPITGKSPVIFLDTQYRMPSQIGNFIAQTVYPSKDSSEDSEPLLKSSEDHPLADTESLLCYFVNVPGQQVSHGTSWKNLEECKAIVQLASFFQSQGKNFKIITPYDAQRSLIEAELKAAELEWGDKCFNVDSFQGNEEDYIIISLVRSRDLGFLADKRRMNVMLSRCKRGMVIFTNKAYITKYAGPEKSLIGALIINYYEDGAWIEVGDMEKTVFV